MNAGTEPDPAEADPGLATRMWQRRAFDETRRRVSRERALDVFYPLAGVGLLLVAWEVGVRLGNVPRYIMVPFSDVLTASIEDADILLHHTWVTTQECLLGFALGALIGISLAVAIAIARQAELSLYPLIVAFHVIPVIAIAPLLSIWFGYGLLPKVLIVANFTFFPVMLNTIIGLRSTETLELHLFRSIGASWPQGLWRLRLPNALPHVFAGLKLASTLALIGAVVAEFVSSSTGLGYYVLDANGKLDTRQLMTGVIYLGLTGIVLFGIVDAAERIATPWHVSRRTERSS